MPAKLNVLAISGSTRTSSSNLNLIHAIAALASERFVVTIYEGLSSLPHFNPDLDHEQPPTEVKQLRQLINDTDGVLICSPEYAMGVPGSLKNAIDWTVSSMEFSQKPVALITASLSGEKAHQSLLDNLNVIEARVTNDTSLLIPFIKTKVAADNITDTATLKQVQKLLTSFTEMMHGPAHKLDSEE